MTKRELSQFIKYLAQNNTIYATQEEDDQVAIDELHDAKKAVLDNRLPFYSWKRFFIPECQELFEYQGTNLVPPQADSNMPIALLGLNLLDLKSVILYDRVFSNDPYYQNRRQNLLIIAHNFLPGPENNLAHIEYKEEDLRQYTFDIFLAAPPKDEESLSPSRPVTNWQVFAGSQKGEKLLQDFGYTDYRRVECPGSLNEGHLGSKMNIFREKLKNHHNPKIWEELDKRCIECGKCTIVCPTCFCFRIDDAPSLEENNGVRQRCWDSCFYQEFSEVAGGNKFLKTAAERIHFWYYHKFARIPDEYSITGCVGCHRCYQVCPVEIDIKKVLEEVEQS